LFNPVIGKKREIISIWGFNIAVRVPITKATTRIKSYNPYIIPILFRVYVFKVLILLRSSPKCNGEVLRVQLPLYCPKGFPNKKGCDCLALAITIFLDFKHLDDGLDIARYGISISGLKKDKRMYLWLLQFYTMA